MKILSIEFTDKWSWGLIFNEFKKINNNEIERVFMLKNDVINEDTSDIILIQNATLLDKVKNKIKSICRLGGNRTFTGRNIDPIIDGMSKCFAIIATNKNLYEIAKIANQNSYLIPNGLNLDEWKPKEKPFIAGFCANISSAQYSQYKGYDLVKEACENLGIELRTALYKDQQIPHDRMMQDFYYQIDCIVHPTLGEGCSNTLMEACACGVPIITTREAGYHGEMMEDNLNVLFCERTVDSIKSKLSLLKNNPIIRKRLSVEARIFAESHHNIITIAKQYEEIFQLCHANISQEKIKEMPIEKPKRPKRIWRNGKIVHEAPNV